MANVGPSQEKKKKIDYYKVLGVPRGAGNDQVSAKNSPTSNILRGSKHCTTVQDGCTFTTLNDPLDPRKPAMIFHLPFPLLSCLLLLLSSNENPKVFDDDSRLSSSFLPVSSCVWHR